MLNFKIASELNNKKRNEIEYDFQNWNAISCNARTIENIDSLIDENWNEKIFRQMKIKAIIYQVFRHKKRRNHEPLTKNLQQFW